MPVEDALPGSSKRMLSYSPSRSPASTRLCGLAPQRTHRPQATAKKPSEPLRRAVADCLSPAAQQLHGNPSALVSEAARTLRDFMADPLTTDMAYIMLVEHALAERDRSPAVLPRCVGFLKFYLLRYVPKVSTLQQIDLFCVNSIAECESVNSRRVPELSNSSTQQSKTPLTVSSAHVPLLPASSFASASLIKSLNYVRSLVARHIPKLSFQPIMQSVSSNAAKQSLPSLSSLLSRSFNSQLSPDVSNKDSLEIKETSGPSAAGLSTLQEGNVGEECKYIYFDILKWRWPSEGEYKMSYSVKESNGVMGPQDIHTHGFLEVGAAGLLVGDMETQIKDHTLKNSVNHNFPDIDLLRPSTATVSTNFVSTNSHLKAITAFKRMKPGPHQVWANVPVSTFHPRVRPLFQYRHYSEQQPLKLSFAEIHEVIAEVCSESTTPTANKLRATSQSNAAVQPAADVAISVLIKLVIDMFMLDPGTATPLILYMLEGMLSSGRVSSRARAFDFILNLGVHAQLLEPMLLEDPPSPEAVQPLQESYLKTEQPKTPGKMITESSMHQRIFSAIDNFESWLLVILFEVLRLLVQIEEKEEIVWASGLSCLFYFVCDKGKILRSRLNGLDIRVIKTLLEISNEYSWAGVVHCKLVCMLTNMFYRISNESTKDAPEIPTFLVEQVDLVGGIGFICLQYSQANSREEKRNLFLILFDYVVHQINEVCLVSGASVYAYDDIQPLVTMLMLANAPEAFYIAVKHGMEGIGEILKRSISTALLRSTNYERQNMLLDKIMRKLDGTISMFTRLDTEFSFMIRLTKTCKSLMSIKDVLGKTDIGEKAKVSWITLHSLLHSDRSSYRHHGYIWLVELLVLEVSESRNGSILSNIKNLQEQISVAGNQDSAYSEVPLAICILCGLLKSKHNFVRWGFLFVLEKLLTRCKLLLDETELQDTNDGNSSSNHNENCLVKANAVIDIMSSALSLVVQINERDYINILKMCDMLFAQLCLRLHSATTVPFVDFNDLSHLFGCTTESHEGDLETHVSSEGLKPNQLRDELSQTANTLRSTDPTTITCETSSMAALLLRGRAIAPMQLVARVPASLFYWPLIQLAGAATDDIALGVAVGSKGRGNLPGATSDIRATLLLLLIGKCTADPGALVEIEGKEFFRGLLDDMDSRVAYYSAAFLLKRMMTEEPEIYQRMLQSLIFKAQQSNNEKLLENPYLQMRGILQLSNDLGTML